MRLRVCLIGLLLLSVAGCLQTGPAGEKLRTSEVTPVAEAPDPFVVMIDAGRWGVIIDRALEGAQLAETPVKVRNEEVFRADLAQKTAAARLIELRNQVCSQGLAAPRTCKLHDWPSWTLEAPTDRTPIAEIQRRNDWLAAVSEPFTSAGCDTGARISRDDMFCSVE